MNEVDIITKIYSCPISYNINPIAAIDIVDILFSSYKDIQFVVINLEKAIRSSPEILNPINNKINSFLYLRIDGVLREN